MTEKTKIKVVRRIETTVETTVEIIEDNDLVIPEEINGLPVVQLGGSIGYPNRPIEIKSKKLRKIYFNNSNYLDIERFNILQPLEIIAMYDNCYFQTVFGGNMYNDSISCFTTEEIYNNNVEKLSIRPKECFSVIGIANLTFIEIADEKETVVWIDNISEGSVYYCPYIEREWYLDRACTIPWDKNYKLEVGQEKISVYSQKA